MTAVKQILKNSRKKTASKEVLHSFYCDSILAFITEKIQFMIL